MSIDFSTHHEDNLMVPITDSIAKPVLHNADVEPEPGSVVLMGGEFGSAWQKSFTDGLWYCTQRSGGGKTWAWLLTKRNLVLVYEAEVREGGQA